MKYQAFKLPASASRSVHYYALVGGTIQGRATYARASSSDMLENISMSTECPKSVAHSGHEFEDMCHDTCHASFLGIPRACAHLHAGRHASTTQDLNSQNTNTKTAFPMLNSHRTTDKLAKARLLTIYEGSTCLNSTWEGVLPRTNPGLAVPHFCQPFSTHNSKNAS